MYYQGWPVPFLVSTKEIKAGEEVVVDYGKKYWQCRNTEKSYFSAVLEAQEHPDVTEFREIFNKSV